MRMAVTGSSGFVGTNLCRFLCSKGHQVVAVARSVDSARHLKKMGVDIYLSDILNPKKLRDAFKGVDSVIHLAALFNHPEASWEDYKSVNIQGTHNVMQAAINCEVPRVIHCSTVGVATGKGKMPFSENTVYSPPEWDKYETTKCAGEQAALAYHNQKNLSVVVLRPAQIYGPEDVSKARFYRLVKKGFIVNPGKTLKHLIYVEDLCRAFEIATIHNNAPGEIFIIGNPNAILLKNLINLVADELQVKTPYIKIPARPVTLICTLIEMASNAFKIKPPVFRRSMDFFTKSVSFDVSKAMKLLEFEAITSVKEGVSHTAAWYKANNLV